MPAAESRDCHPFRSIEARERYLSYYDGQAAFWPVDSVTRMVRTDDGETFVRISGPDDGPPLVLLPAARASSLCWVAVIEALSQRFRTYAVDAIYDVGRSVNARPIRTAADATAWLDRLLDALGLTEGVNLMGLSLGGWLAAEYVLHDPKRLSRVVWLAPAGAVMPISSGFIARGFLCMLPSRATFGSFTRWVMPDAARSTGHARTLFENAIDDMVLSAQCFTMRPMPGGAPRSLRDAELRDIVVPVLYLVGEHERVCSDANAAVSRLNRVAPQIETAIIPGVGHDLFILQPEAVSHRVLQFLAT